MKVLSVVVLFGVMAVSGCAAEVVMLGSEDEDGGAFGWDDDGGGSPGGLGDEEPYGVPCSHLTGTAKLLHWDETESGYAPACFSFQLASQDVAVTKNDWDVLYYGDAFRVRTVVDDESTIFDLGEVELEALPSQVDESAFEPPPSGVFDQAQALRGHTYWVRTLDGDSRQVVGFVLRKHEPGVSVELEWVRSLDPDQMVIPVECLD